MTVIPSTPGDVVGRSGVEATYDALLRGTGSRDVIVTSHGKDQVRAGSFSSRVKT
jgi:cell division protein FtsI/penicillin-binding protein 2